MKIAMLTRFGSMGANSRYRLLQYIPLLQRAGHTVEVRPMLDDAYLRALYSSGRRSRWQVARGYVRRFAQLSGLQHYGIVLCDQEFFPYLPAAAERMAARCCPRLVVDYDDAAYCKYLHIPGLRSRIPALMAQAEAVVVGNRTLQSFAAQYSRNVHVIPTVVDLARYTARQDYSAAGGVRLVWIGTPVTAGFLQELAPVLMALKTKFPDLRLRLIGAGPAILQSTPFAEVVEWSEADEARLLAECDIGIMPLPDTEFTRAKCGLKLIQCMAAGLPVVGSPVGANCDIVGHGEQGYLAAGPQEWFEALERLILSSELRRELGRNAAAKAARCYSLEQGFAAWMRILDPSNCGSETCEPEICDTATGNAVGCSPAPSPIEGRL
jgi:glycosyltransferase involved in cell wall biosynthesis